MLLSPPSPLSGFNISATAQMYSTLAGVLAGFSFVGIITVVTYEPRKDRFPVATPGDKAVGNAQSSSPESAHDKERRRLFTLIARVLGASFLGLIIVSLSYASLSGAFAARGSEVSEEVILGPAFAACAVQIVYALVLLTESLDTPFLRGKGALRMRPIVARWAPLLAVFFVYDSARDYETLRYDHFTYITFYGVIFGIVQLIVSVVLYQFWSGKIPYGRNKFMEEWDQDKKDSTIKVLTDAAFGLTVISGLWFVAFDAFSDENTMTWPITPIITMGLTLLIMVGTTYQLARSGERETVGYPGLARWWGKLKKYIKSFRQAAHIRA